MFKTTVGMVDVDSPALVLKRNIIKPKNSKLAKKKAPKNILKSNIVRKKLRMKSGMTYSLENA